MREKRFFALSQKSQENHNILTSSEDLSSGESCWMRTNIETQSSTHSAFSNKSNNMPDFGKVAFSCWLFIVRLGNISQFL